MTTSTLHKISKRNLILASTALLMVTLATAPVQADIFNDIVNIQVDDIDAGEEAVASAEDVAPLEFDLELEHSGAGGFDVDISPAGGCDFLVRITHWAPIMGAPVGTYEWFVTDIHMRDADGNEMFHKITGVELPSPFDNEMPTVAINYTDWIVGITTGPFPSSSFGASNDYIVKVAVIGDVNKDCQINLLDVDPFVDLLASGGYSVEADINQDGALNLLDVNEFIGLLSE